MASQVIINRVILAVLTFCMIIVSSCNTDDSAGNFENCIQEVIILDYKTPNPCNLIFILPINSQDLNKKLQSNKTVSDIAIVGLVKDTLSLNELADLRIRTINDTLFQLSFDKGSFISLIRDNNIRIKDTIDHQGNAFVMRMVPAEKNNDLSIFIKWDEDLNLLYKYCK